MSHLCASTVATWFVDVCRVAGPGLEARECLQDLPAGTDVPGFPRLPLLLGMQTYMQALLLLLLLLLLQKKKPKKKANTVHPRPALHAQK